MPEHEIDGGELWLEQDEAIVKIVDLGAPGYLGLITRRTDGRYYASALRLSDKPGYRFDVPRWNYRRGMQQTVCESIASAEDAILQFHDGEE